jgi:hypothetical protein
MGWTNEKWYGTIVVMEDKRKVVQYNSSNKKDGLWNGQTQSGTVQ